MPARGHGVQKAMGMKCFYTGNALQRYHRQVCRPPRYAGRTAWGRNLMRKWLISRLSRAEKLFSGAGKLEL